MAVNLAEKYSSKVAERFYQESVVVGHTSKAWDWDGTKAVKVYSITTVAPVDYVRGTRTEAVGSAGNANQYYARYGVPTEVDDTVQTMTITQDKSVSLVVDKGNNKQQMMVKNAGKVMQREMREQFIPMFDKYCLATWAGYEGVGSGVDASLTKSNIVEAITKGMTTLGNANALTAGCQVYIPWTTYGLLLNSTEFLNLEKLGNKALGLGVIGQVRGLNVIPVPDSYMPAGASSTKANFIITNSEAVLAPTQIKDMKLHIDPPGISGNLMEIRWLFDAFVLDAKKEGVYVSWNGAQE